MLKRSGVAVLLATLLASCGQSNDAESATRPTVVVVGDSITYRSTSQIETALRDAYDARVTALDGHTAGELQPALNQELRNHPDIAVVAVGTNDATRRVESWRKEFDAVIRSVASVPCVVLVNVPARAADYQGLLASPERPSSAVGAAWNAALADAAGKLENAHDIDWNRAVIRDSSLTDDGIHPSDAGKAWLASAIRTSVDECDAPTSGS